MEKEYAIEVTWALMCLESLTPGLFIVKRVIPSDDWHGDGEVILKNV